MSVPTQQTDYATRLPALLTSRYAGQPVVSGLATSFAASAQTVENNFWSVMNTIASVFVNGPPAGGPWDFIDKLGALVGITRDGRDDADFWAAIQIQIAINTSNGRPNDFLRIVGLVSGVSSPNYYLWPPAAFEIALFNISSSTALALVQYLGKARPAGVAGNLRYTLDTGPYVRWGSHYGGVTGAGFASHYGGAPADKLSGLEAF